MDHPKAVAAFLALAAVALGGCATMRWTLAKTFRAPGEVLETFPDAVWEEYDCAERDRPFFQIERNELVPTRVAAGGEFNHHLVYVLCPAEPTEVVAGRLATRIRFKGDPIVRDAVDGYEIKPGRWTVDAFVQLPPNAEPGVYAYEIAFEGGRVRFDEHLTFVVDAP